MSIRSCREECRLKETLRGQEGIAHWLQQKDCSGAAREVRGKPGASRGEGVTEEGLRSAPHALIGQVRWR